ncbi:hypothetical protein [Streptomyces niveiscabiei]|uniref:Tetratricopeptide repeat protein n=1 Tax=Streptomyces niveiscabiei TaxID=164115 RepID=A0ABW9HZ16_9ACTN
MSPLAYLGKLATALVSYSYAAEFRERPDIVFALCGEAARAAREIPGGEPGRTETLVRALGAYEGELFRQGRREEGLAVCEEAASVGREGFERGQVESRAYGSGRLAVVLAEEGRHVEAAEVAGREVDDSFWALTRWAAELDAAGCHGAASEAFGRLVDVQRGRLVKGEGSTAITVWALVQHSRLAGTVGADTVRAEALGLLRELGDSGERRAWSDLLAFWTTLLALSSRSLEPAGSPAPAFGSAFSHWSPDVRAQYIAGIDELEREAADPDTPLSELAVVQHRLTVRSALYHHSRGPRVEQPLAPLFGRSVALARQLGDPVWLARTLTDRAMFLVAVKRYREAYADFREAVELTE